MAGMENVIKEGNYGNESPGKAGFDNNFNEPLTTHKTLLDKFNDQCDYLGEKCGINGKIVLGLIIVCLILVIFNIGQQIVANIVGIVYPAYWSIKALETRTLEDDKQWLTYWVVFAILILLESIFISFFNFIPFYIFFKLIFLIWFVL